MPAKMPRIRQLPRNFPAVVCKFRKSDADKDCQAVLAVSFKLIFIHFLRPGCVESFVEGSVTKVILP